MREWWTAVFSIAAVQTNVTEVFYSKCNFIYARFQYSNEGICRPDRGGRRIMNFSDAV